MIDKIEICANSFASAIAAQKGGAERIELCSVLGMGGVTPSYGLMATVRERLNIDINILIRPREGDFLYSEYEIEEMIRDIELCSKLKMQGVVFGALNYLSEIDIPANKKLIDAAKRNHLETTFHRAIDLCPDVFGAMENIISLGFNRILTSGGHQSAFEGIDTIAKMEKKAAGRIIIMAGGGINLKNARKIAFETGISEIHFSASCKKESAVAPQVRNKIISFTPESIGGDYIYSCSDENIITDIINSIKLKS
ncbi:MAG: copper homeostasis protein CutC [Bacteroidales bacterium]|nr:copper homeostasis protein CutC [Bacteroidales bacterium]